MYSTRARAGGALPEVTPAAQAVLVLAGVFITDRVNKVPLVLTFLGVYYLLFTAAAFVSDPAWVSEVFRPPDLEAVLFFAFFILTDPPTSPVKYADQIACGAIVAVVAFAVFEWIGAVYYLLAGALVGNVWEAWRRASRRTNHTFPRGVGAFLREITPWRNPVLQSPAATGSSATRHDAASSRRQTARTPKTVTVTRDTVETLVRDIHTRFPSAAQPKSASGRFPFSGTKPAHETSRCRPTGVRTARLWNSTTAITSKSGSTPWSSCCGSGRPGETSTRDRDWKSSRVLRSRGHSV